MGDKTINAMNCVDIGKPGAIRSSKIAIGRMRDR